METLNLPSYEFRTTSRDGTRSIYDPIRQTYVRLTPEEWVRQHFVQYLVQELSVPSGLVGVEVSFQYEKRAWRADVVAYDRTGAPILLVECKAPRVSVGQDTFDQVARYNLALDVPYLVVTNGLERYACRINLQAQEYAFLDDLPSYEELLEREV